jgi:hypothetical protein
VKTKIVAFKENAKDTYMKLKFTMGKRLDEQETANVEFLKAQWLPIMDAQVINQAEVDQPVDNNIAPHVHSSANQGDL